VEPALPADIRLGWKGLPGTYTLAYYENPKITAVKSFIVQARGPNVIKLFTAINYECSKQARVFALAKPF
jgi:hypothetical protein